MNSRELFFHLYHGIKIITLFGEQLRTIVIFQEVPFGVFKNRKKNDMKCFAHSFEIQTIL